jgi:hypothetical protein
MPALLGVLSPHPQPLDLAGGADLAHLRILASQRVEAIRLGPLEVATCERDQEPVRLARSRRSGATLLLKGFLDAAALPPAAAEAFEGHAAAAAVLARIEADGAAAAVGLPGVYAAILWEPGPGRLTIANDLLGLYPLHVASAAGRFIFGTRPSSFALVPGFHHVPDLEAVVELLRIEHLLGERSMVAGVSLLPPGSLLEVRPGGLPAVRRVRDPFAGRDPEPATLEDAAARLGAAFDEAFAWRPASPRVVLPLSGGKDSRTVACELLRAGTVPRDAIASFSLGAPEQWDARCARRLARRLGLDWRIVPHDPTLQDRWLGRFTALADGSANAFASWWAQILEEAEPGAAIASGYLGDALTGAHLDFFDPAYADPRRAPGPDRDAAGFLASRAARCFTRDALARTLRPELAALLDGPARTLEARHRALPGLPRHARAIRTDVLERQRRFIANQIHLYRQSREVFAPFTHPAFVRACLSLGEDHVRGQRAYALALGRRHPAAARLPEAKDRRPIHGRAVDRARCALEERLVEAWKRVRSRVSGTPWPERDFFLSFAHLYRDDLAADLGPLDRLFDPDRLRREIRDDPPTSNRLRILHTLRAWLSAAPAASRRRAAS